MTSSVPGCSWVTRRWTAPCVDRLVRRIDSVTCPLGPGRDLSHGHFHVLEAHILKLVKLSSDVFVCVPCKLAARSPV